MCRNATDFCILSLYLTTSLNLLVLSFLVESLESSLYNITPSAKSFTSSFQILMPFLSFSCLTALARASGTKVNKGGQSEHRYVVPDLKGQVFNLSPLSMTSAVASHIWSLLC